MREARQLAENVGAVLEGKQPEPFVYKSKGALASLGGGRGVAEVFGMRLSGFPAWLLWRSYYLSFVPGFATKVRIAVQWTLDLRARPQHGADRGGRGRGRPATCATAPATGCSRRATAPTASTPWSRARSS